MSKKTIAGKPRGRGGGRHPKLDSDANLFIEIKPEDRPLMARIRLLAAVSDRRICDLVMDALRKEYGLEEAKP